MIKEIKLRTRNYHIMRIIYFLLIAFALLAINEFGIFQIMKGPIPLTGVWNPEELDRKYVTLDVDRVYGSFGYSYEENTDTKKGIMTSVYYLGYYYDGTTNYNRIFAIKVPFEAKYRIEQISNDVLNNKIPTDKLTIKGTFEKMDGDILEFYQEAIQGFPIESIPYVISDGEVGGSSISTSYGFAAASMIALVVAIISTIAI